MLLFAGTKDLAACWGIFILYLYDFRFFCIFVNFQGRMVITRITWRSIYHYCRFDFQRCKCRHCTFFPYLAIIASLCFIVNFNLIILLKRFNSCIICVVYCSPRSRKANCFGKFCRFQLFHDLILQLYLDYHRSFWCVENYFSFISFYI